VENSVGKSNKVVEGVNPLLKAVAYIKGLKELDGFKPDFIVMICNTIHLYINILQNQIKTPILDLKEEIKNHLEINNIKSALIIGTPNTISQGLYRFDNIKSIEPTNEEISKLTGLIFNFNKGIEKNKQIQETKNICLKYLHQGAETVILGCTEFAVMLSNEDFPKINTIDVLVNATIERFQILKSNSRSYENG